MKVLEPGVSFSVSWHFTVYETMVNGLQNSGVQLTAIKFQNFWTSMYFLKGTLSTLEYGSVNYRIPTDHSLEAAAKFRNHCFSLHRRMWNRQRKTEICEIYLPVKWVNDISFLFWSLFRCHGEKWCIRTK